MATIGAGCRWRSANANWPRDSRSEAMPCAIPIIIRKAWQSAVRDGTRRRGWKECWPRSATASIEERRSREWLKIKIRHRLECVIGGYTEPEGSRAHFGSIVLGTLRQAGTADSCGAGRQRLRSEIAGRDLEDAEEDCETKKNSVLRRSRGPAQSELGEAGTGGGNRICGMDRWNQRGQRTEIAGTGISGPARRQRSQGVPL